MHILCPFLSRKILKKSYGSPEYVTYLVKFLQKETESSEHNHVCNECMEQEMSEFM
jgi:hypothetical protein